MGIECLVKKTPTAAVYKLTKCQNTIGKSSFIPSCFNQDCWNLWFYVISGVVNP